MIELACYAWLGILHAWFVAAAIAIIITETKRKPMIALYVTHPRSGAVHLTESGPFSQLSRTFCGLLVNDHWVAGDETTSGLMTDCKRCRENALTKEPRF